MPIATIRDNFRFFDVVTGIKQKMKKVFLQWKHRIIFGFRKTAAVINYELVFFFYTCKTHTVPIL